MSNKDCGLISPECELRHRTQDEINKQIKDIHDALLGTPLSKVPSIKQKVDEIYGDRAEVRKWLAGTVVTIIIFIFTLGMIYEKFNHVQTEITNLAERVKVLEGR